MSSKRSLLSIIQVGVEMWNRQKELEKEQQLINGWGERMMVRVGLQEEDD